LCFGRLGDEVRRDGGYVDKVIGDAIMANTKIRRVTFDGTIFANGHLIVTVACTGAVGSTGDGSSALLATLNKPAGVDIDDEANNTLRELQLETGGSRAACGR